MQISYKMIQNLIKLLIIIGALVLVLLIIIDRNNYGDTSTKTTSAATNPTTVLGTPVSVNKVLTPATVPPKVQECYQTVGYSSTGVPSPLTCVNGAINVNAWNAISAQEPKVMSLGYSPNVSVVQAAVCSDISAASSDSAPGADNDLESSAYQISALYYGWNFGPASNFISRC